MIRRLSQWFFGLWLLLSQPSAIAQCIVDLSAPHVDATQAQQVRLLIAGYISEFPFYVQWPEEVFEGHPDELWIGLVGEDPLGQDGRTYLARRGFRRRKYVVTWLRNDLARDRLERFQILYIGRTSASEQKGVLHAIEGLPILTCGVDPDFLTEGGMVQFQVAGQAVSFNVHMENATRDGLTVDPLFISYGMLM